MPNILELGCKLDVNDLIRSENHSEAIELVINQTDLDNKTTLVIITGIVNVKGYRI